MYDDDMYDDDMYVYKYVYIYSNWKVRGTVSTYDMDPLLPYLLVSVSSIFTLRYIHVYIHIFILLFIFIIYIYM